MKVEIKISSEILQLIAQIDEFNGRWQALGAISRDRLTQLRKNATIESVGSSTRIEGSQLTDSQVETLLAKIEIQKFTTRDEQEVAGYARTMDLVFDSWEELSISESHVQQLHQILLSYSTKDERHRGGYKSLDNHVVAFDADGKQVGVVFHTASPFDTPREMESLFSWFKEAQQNNDPHRLLRIAVFIVRFLAIHPFQDGNGRISRVLTTLLLLHGGYCYVPYASIERIVEDNKESYYRALRATQTSFQKDEIDWNAWIVFFLKTLWKQCEVLRKKVEDYRVMQAAQFTPLALKILSLFEAHEQLTNREIVSLTNSNRNTVKVTLTSLVAEQLLIKVGKGRAVRYKVNP